MPTLQKTLFYWRVLQLHGARLRYVYYGTLGLVCILVGSFSFAFSAPAHFPSGEVIAISAADSSSEIATQLKSVHAIRSVILFKFLVRSTGIDRQIQSGDYVFSRPISLLTIVGRLAAGQRGVTEYRVTFPEGTTVREMAPLLREALPNFNEIAFLNEGIALEGYLFPDTYFFPASTTPQEVIKKMRATFDARIAPIQNTITPSTHSLKETVIMASLVEGEAKSDTDKRIVAGILWHRLALGMPLQVDAAFGYMDMDPPHAPTAADLASASPYNTYRHIGLPPTPINNPGISSLDATVAPTQTNYLYYLTGKDGEMHYAKTFAEHKANRKKYLD